MPEVHETCSCGATLDFGSAWNTDCREAAAQFEEAHRSCREGPPPVLAERQKHWFEDAMLGGDIARILVHHHWLNVWPGQELNVHDHKVVYFAAKEVRKVGGFDTERTIQRAVELDAITAVEYEHKLEA